MRSAPPDTVQPGVGTDTAPAQQRIDDYLRRSSRHRWWLTGVAGATLLTIAVSICIGSYAISPGDVLEALGGGPAGGSAATAVVWKLRLPRILLAAAAGAALATSGAAYQAAYRNPLVDPSILGVSAGAAFGAGLAVVLPLPLGMAPAAFFGGVLAVGATYALSSVNGERPTVTVILSGIVVGAIFTAGFGLLQYLGSNEQLRRLVFWLLGGFYEATWESLRIVLPLTFVLVFLLITLGWDLNILSMGDEDAVALGRDPESIRRRVLLLATALTATAVSVSGIVSWIGLLVPHAARLLVGSDNRLVVPMSAALGAVFAVVSDDVARTISTGEIPIGIITSLLGAPYLLYLLRTRGATLVGT